MVRIKKENTILIILVFVLVIGIFVSSNPDFVNEITGKFVGISGMQAADECIYNSDTRVINLRSKIQERINVIESFGGPKGIYPGHDLSGMRSAVVDQLSQYYWNLDRVEPAPNNVFDDVNYKLIASDQPLAYSYTLNELFQQALGRDSWTNPDSNCIKEIDLTELEKVINKLEWISLQIGTGSTSRYSGQDMGIAVFSNMLKAEWYEERVGSDGSGYSNFDDSWSYTLDRFNSFASFPVYNNICPLKNYGNGHWISRYDRYYSEKFYNKCLVKYDFSSLPESIEIKEAKAYFVSPNYAYYTGNSVFDAIPATININGEDHIIDIGYNLISVDVSNKKGEIKLTPDLQQDVKPTITDKINYKQYDKGTKGNFLVVFVNVFSKNEPPNVEEVKFELSDDADILEKVRDREEYKNEKVKVESTGEEYKVVREYDPVVCSAVISDPDDKDNADGVLSARAIFLINNEKYIEGPMLDCKFDKNTKKTYCKGNPVDLHQYRSVIRGSKIKCKVIPKDKYLEGNEKESEELVVAANIYYFFPLNGDSYGTVKKQYDEDYHKMSEVDKKFNSVGKAVYLKRQNREDLTFKEVSIIRSTGTVQTRAYKLREFIRYSVLKGSFDFSSDFIIAIIPTDRIFCEGFGIGCFMAIENIYVIGAMESSLTHGLGHIVGKFRDEYDIKWWYIDTVMGKFEFTANVIGQDGKKHFPHCCLGVCCEIGEDNYVWKLKSDCPVKLSPLHVYPHQVLDIYCQQMCCEVEQNVYRWKERYECMGGVQPTDYPRMVSSSYCLDARLCMLSDAEFPCMGMPYKDGKPYDDLYNRDDGDYSYSRMGNGQKGPFIYPEDARCPLRHC